MKNDGLQFYRCCMCGHVVNMWDIREKHGCPKCGCIKIKATNLSFFEKIKEILKHPAVWRWKDAAL